ncbi:septum site-determining protein MinC [Xanthomonas campestris pv. campestris]|uniref:Probable septum site-determining protein MinC n=1 Tax=Xanthomonas campestris pv. campestris (strain ATCC 33913 / DSM 3586 / NCPPB 528 / LMG 568 / P 25) TaxID=190485 RepID=MINC_XANCP|nr:septum site-determining protein MinC [Xanthomonas campestris]Q8PBJ4.1 RecName: Full=Probable septum site-determining protein MinC [Xanthomonas campestris pv. campestris str. ATCC 33913]AAM40424.1 cell division inhibitor [Xanthomonas campestris pv. campestris str. ATCC 33913]AKS17055.1 septum formation inhibitor [Xanthomonas campestris pv. campestris]MBD8246169.1 septum site-determining protein MinC [Xanthomonas campestris]MCC5051796.1 septum site-determining protein MinC [Xanthomonas campes
MSSVNVDFEQAGELKIGQVGIANLRIRTLDVPRLVREMQDRVTRAPKLFGRAAVILDFGGLAQAPDLATAKALLDGLRSAGVLPVALAYGTSEIDLLSQQLGIPLLAKFRAQYETAAVSPPPPPPPPPARAEPAAPVARPAPGRMQRNAVRSGQQLYAENCDLTVLSTVGAGAEVIADGSIHIYGTLRGRALAGAQGNPDARIFCRDFHAELVAIAGHYKVLDDVPMDLRGKAVQVWLEQDQIKIAALD